MSIASRIEAIEQHLTNDYSVLEVAGADLTNVDKNIVNLKLTWQERLLYFINNGTDVVWNNWEKVTGEGETLTLNSTEEAPMKIDLKGNTSQETTTGKNLVNVSLWGLKALNTIGTWNRDVYTSEGIVYTPVFKNNLLQYINVNGTATAQSMLVLKTVDNTTLPYGSYILNGCPSGGSLSTYRINWAYSGANDTENGSTATFNRTGQIRIIIDSGTTVSNLQFKPMVRLTTISDSTYEPYTGGIASPNPNYPQGIHVVSGDNTIKVEGKNLFDTATIEQGGFNYHTGENFTSNKIIRNTIYNIKPNTQYTISCNKALGECAFCCFDKNGNSLDGNFTQTTNNNYTFTTNSSASYIKIRIGNSSYPKVISDSYDVQLEKSNQATTYEPYQSASYPISLDYTNLFKKQDISSDDLNKRLNQIGENYNENGYFISPFIKVDKDTQYTINYTPTAYTRICYYVSNNTNSFISKNDDTSSFTTPSTCQYLRFCNLMADIDNIRLEKGSTITNNYIELCKIGDYQDKIAKSTGKNLCNTTFELGGIDTTTGQNGSGTDRVRTKDYVEVKPNTTYTLSGVQGSRVVCFYNSSKAYLSYTVVGSQSTSGTFTTPNDTSYIRWYIIQTNTNINEMLNEGTTALPYEPYGKVWHVNKQIGKVVLDGSESWTKSSNTNVNRYYIPGTFINTILDFNTIDLISDYFTCITQTQSDAHNIGLAKLNSTSVMINFSLSDTDFDTLEKYKTWLSTHNTIVYYVLANPTYTEITDSTLLEQLEALYNAKSKNSQTNITQENNDLPFILDATALKQLN